MKGLVQGGLCCWYQTIYAPHFLVSVFTLWSFYTRVITASNIVDLHSGDFEQILRNADPIIVIPVNEEKDVKSIKSKSKRNSNRSDYINEQSSFITAVEIMKTTPPEIKHQQARGKKGLTKKFKKARKTLLPSAAKTDVVIEISKTTTDKEDVIALRPGRRSDEKRKDGHLVSLSEPWKLAEDVVDLLDNILHPKEIQFSDEEALGFVDEIESAVEEEINDDDSKIVFPVQEGVLTLTLKVQQGEESYNEGEENNHIDLVLLPLKQDTIIVEEGGIIQTYIIDEANAQSDKSSIQIEITVECVDEMESAVEGVRDDDSNIVIQVQEGVLTRGWEVEIVEGRESSEEFNDIDLLSFKQEAYHDDIVVVKGIIHNEIKDESGIQSEIMVAQTETSLLDDTTFHLSLSQDEMEDYNFDIPLDTEVSHNSNSLLDEAVSHNTNSFLDEEVSHDIPFALPPPSSAVLHPDGANAKDHFDTGSEDGLSVTKLCDEVKIEDGEDISLKISEARACEKDTEIDDSVGDRNDQEIYKESVLVTNQEEIEEEKNTPHVNNNTTEDVREQKSQEPTIQSSSSSKSIGENSEKIKDVAQPPPPPLPLPSKDITKDKGHDKREQPKIVSRRGMAIKWSLIVCLIMFTLVICIGGIMVYFSSC